MIPEFLHVLTDEQKNDVLNLWNSEFPEKLAFDAMADFDDFLKGLKNKIHLVVNNELGSVIAWLLLFTRDEERWFSILVNAENQGQGLGQLLMDLAKEKEPILNGWVLDHDNDKKLGGGIYYSPLSFYKKHGFEIFPKVRFEKGNISAVKINWTKE